MSYDRCRCIRRLARLLLMAQERRYLPPTEQLARELDCSVRTVRRDLQALNDVGVPVRWRKAVA